MEYRVNSRWTTILTTVKFIYEATELWNLMGQIRHHVIKKGPLILNDDRKKKLIIR